MEQSSTSALTTLLKVLEMLNLTGTTPTTSLNSFLTNLINQVSLWAQSYTGGRNFLSQQYTEVYDTRDRSQKIFLRQRPVTSDNINGLMTVNYRSGIPTVPDWVLYDPNSYVVYLLEGYIHFYGQLPKVHQGLQVIYTAGYLIGNLPQVITSITQTGTTATVTVASTAGLKTGDQVYIYGSSVTNDNGYQTITVATGTTFTFTSSTSGTRTLTSGLSFPISAEYDTTRHTLPEDLTQAVTMLVAKFYNTRYSQGFDQESVGQNRIVYSSINRLLQDDKVIQNILDSYKTLHFAV